MAGCDCLRYDRPHPILQSTGTESQPALSALLASSRRPGRHPVSSRLDIGRQFIEGCSGNPVGVVGIGVQFERRETVVADIVYCIEDDHSAVRIDYAPSLADWKTAWDYVHFEGFFETEMSMQFTWKGADSALAAPLVLDPARLLAHADEYGGGGLQPHLASFFKTPMDIQEHDLSRQFARLHEYVYHHSEGDREQEGEP